MNILLELRCSRRLLFVAFLMLIGGCATYGQNRFFEEGTRSDSAVISGTATTASVYILRKRALLQGMMYRPIAPFAIASDNKIITILPVGTYVHLQMPQGKHTFTRLALQKNVLGRVARVDLPVNLEAGRTYFVSTQAGFPNPSFEIVDDVRGIEMLKENVSAKIIYAGATVDKFIERVQNPSKNFPSQQSTTESFSMEDFLPSKEQIGKAFEIVATVAFVALLVIGASHSDTSISHQTTNQSRYNPPAIYGSASNSRMQVTQQDSETRLRSMDSGVVYSINSESITGTDGSRYRVSGNNIYSSTGEYYQRIGNEIIGSDGRSCSIIGSFLDCKKK